MAAANDTDPATVDEGNDVEEKRETTTVVGDVETAKSKDPTGTKFQNVLFQYVDRSSLCICMFI